MNMNVMDAKVIDTQNGIETYVDLINRIEVKEMHSPTENNPFYEILIGVEYLLLWDRKHQSIKNYFWIGMSEDFQIITLKETDRESLFGAKTAEEREATKELVGEWLIKTNAFNKVIQEMIQKEKAKDVQPEKDISTVLGNIKFLEKLPQLGKNDFIDVAVNRYVS